MRYLLRSHSPPVTRALLIESGSRSILERILPHLRQNWGDHTPIDLVTCYGGLPAGLGSDTTVYRIADYSSPEGRRKLVRLLRQQNYTVAGMICSAEPIMTNWKWMICLRVPAKYFILNENSDYFWLTREQSAHIRRFCVSRLGLTGAGSIRTVGRLIVFPFGLLYLLLYAFVVHLRRYIRTRFIPLKRLSTT